LKKQIFSEKSTNLV